MIYIVYCVPVSTNVLNRTILHSWHQSPRLCPCGCFVGSYQPLTRRTIRKWHLPMLSAGQASVAAIAAVRTRRFQRGDPLVDR